ncbi:RNA polymerase sigma factor region1.1 domain-containing protein [Halarsenatibacter silvermanii]|uniref:Sigma-70 factor, region 1.1 n=1 Tax=Halarsenatibacter silvermanii TaxID=321763 RepID=A0A1G9JTM6_9FIRM|nr:RNA polymerase sigma factor region1.1 domain-containing protein [Halarsenatibacter silvermanii]SDL40811.1 Sigma-70 factor, region 1.1 [Halarsenatibacter silvermanii]
MRDDERLNFDKSGSVHKLLKKGKEAGRLTREEVMEFIAGEEYDYDEIEKIFELLEEQNFERDRQGI